MYQVSCVGICPCICWIRHSRVSTMLIESFLDILLSNFGSNIHSIASSAKYFRRIGEDCFVACFWRCYEMSSWWAAWCVTAYEDCLWGECSHPYQPKPWKRWVPVLQMYSELWLTAFRKDEIFLYSLNWVYWNISRYLPNKYHMGFHL